jgi:outer membrane cobalamin receptor
VSVKGKLQDDNRLKITTGDVIRARYHNASIALGAALLLASRVTLFSQESAPHGSGRDSTRVDTTKVVRVPEVHVNAESIVPAVTRATQPVAIVSRAQIEAAGAADLADAVTFAPGVFVKQYGGVGGLRTISMRGTSAQQSVLLIDGVRYRGSSTDAFDLGDIPADMLDRVEVVRGGNAALYGANALGGVVNIITRPPGDRPLTMSARAGIGSFGEETLGLAATASASRHAWNASVHATTTSGDYPFSFNEYGATSTVRRENADFTNLFGRAGWSYRDSDGVRLAIDAQGFRSERGVPGAVVQGNREQLHARLDEGDLFTAARFSWERDAWTFGATASGRANSMHYSDPDERLLGPDGIDTRFDEHELNGTLRARRQVGDVGVIEGSTDIAYASLRGDNLDPSAGSFVHRAQWSGALSSNWFIEHALLGWEMAIDAGIRGDIFSDLDPALSPSLGMLWRIASTPLRVRARAAWSYRAPSFTEQYYLNYGNRDLRPERSLSIDAGGTYELEEGIALEAALFLISTRDQILSVPRSPVSWSAANIARVLSRGMELGAAGTLFDGLISLNASYTLMRAEDRSEGPTKGSLLPYAPQELVNSIIDLHLGHIAIGASWEYVSHRFTLASNEYASSLPHYLVAGASVASRWAIGDVDLDARLECSNLFNADYQVVRGYPMPGRAFRFELGVRYGGAR